MSSSCAAPGNCIFLPIFNNESTENLIIHGVNEKKKKSVEISKGLGKLSCKL